LLDGVVLFRHATAILVIFIELKSRCGVASKVQKQIRPEMLPTGAVWWMARSARCDDGASSRAWCSVTNWQPPRLADSTQRAAHAVGDAIATVDFLLVVSQSIAIDIRFVATKLVVGEKLRKKSPRYRT
jgi:hypothetical protein